MSLKVNFDYIPEHCMVDFEENALRVKSIDKMIQLKTADITINIIQNTSQSSNERDFELIVDYVDTLKEIYDETKLHEIL